MKEIWIEKLIELLNKYEQEEWCWRLKYWKLHNKYYDDYDRKDEEIRLISKWYGFIKWLVENDKIDLESYCRITSIERKWEKDVYRDEVDSLLMLLAIQDEPIRFLCEIIK